jgi:hypothetical protein
MTDARLPERILTDRRLLQINPLDFQSHIMATVWSVANRTDGLLLKGELRLIPKFSATSAARLVQAGLWDSVGEDFTIVDFAAQQTSRHELEVLENSRRREREKKARQRASRSREGEGGFSPDSMSPGTGAGTAQAGKDNDESRWHDGDEQAGWRTAVPGQPERFAS